MLSCLALVVPDGAYPVVVRQLLEKRAQSLGISPVELQIVKDILRDSSGETAEVLRPYLRTATHALVIRDLEGSGWEDRGADALEQSLRLDLERNGWAGRPLAIIVVEPEIEAWLRFDSRHLADLVESHARKKRDMAVLLFPQVCAEAINKCGGKGEYGKPIRPKETLEMIFREFGIQRSNAHYGSLAERESLRGCRIKSFQRLIDQLKEWFPLDNSLR